ncbi:hypothetical protein AGMMS49546_19580 [Spirochaetia bacterium]|nr:hypothetical protein AGMMS49546_19580 [Spirochaetia bacterium]
MKKIFARGEAPLVRMTAQSPAVPAGGPTRSAVWILVLVLALAAVQGAPAQTETAAPSLNAMSLNGASGLFAIPSGRIGWEGKSDLGLDLGMSYNFIKKDPIAKVGMSFFKWVEFTVASDFQPYVETNDNRLNNTDALMGFKVQFPTKRTAVALGGNVQFINHDSYRTAGQLYAAATYPGSIFGMAAETTLALGYTFHDNPNSNIDFGMGFDLDLLPNIFQHIIHWVTDYSNFSYSDEPLGTEPYYRGSLNTGIRVNFATIPALSKLKFSVDLIATDIFDHGDRSFIMGFVFGVPIK